MQQTTSYFLVVHALSMARVEATTTIVVQVGDVNDSPPVFRQLRYLSHRVRKNHKIIETMIWPGDCFSGGRAGCPVTKRFVMSYGWTLTPKLLPMALSCLVAASIRYE